MGGSSSKGGAADSCTLPKKVNCSSISPVGGNGSVNRLHQGPIHSICPLGQDSILSGGVDKDVNLYSLKQDCCRAKFHGPAKDVTQVCYNNTSKCVYAASRDRSLYGWKWPVDEEQSMENSRQPLRLSQPGLLLQGHSLGVTAVDTSDEYPQLLCSGSRDNSICLWDVDVGKPVSSMYAPRNLVTDVKWIAREKSVVQASEDKTLRVWDLTSCSTVQHFRARNYLQTCCAVSSDQQQFLSGSSGSGNIGGDLTLWDRRNEKRPLRELKGHFESVESCMFFSHENANLAFSVGRDSTIRLWELDSGQELHCQLLSGSGPLTDLTSLDKGNLACSSFTGGISLWTLTTATVDKPLRLTFTSKYL